MRNPSSFDLLLYPWGTANGNHVIGFWVDFSVLLDVTEENSSNFRHGNFTVQRPCIISLTDSFILYQHVSRYEISIDTIYIYTCIDIKSFIILGLFVPSRIVLHSRFVQLPVSALKFLMVWPTHVFFQITN
jgi:hypothetical protein